MRHTLSPDYLVSCNYTIQSLQTQSTFEKHWRRLSVDRKFGQYIFCNIFIGIVAQSSRLIYIYIYYIHRAINLVIQRVSASAITWFTRWGNFVDTTGVITIRKSKDKQLGQKKKEKRTNNDPQNITQKTND
jgi:hypothetical protein